MLALTITLLAGPGRAAAAPPDLDRPDRKETAMQLVSSAENSTLDWRRQYAYLEDIGDGRGWTGDLVGFTTGTGDLLELVRRYTRAHPGNPLAPYLPALRRANGTDSLTWHVYGDRYHLPAR